MPIVFIHGVANRKDSEDYDTGVLARNEYLLNYLATDYLKGTINDQKAGIINPYWGGEGAGFAWNHACIPTENGQAFGSSASQKEWLVILNNYLPQGVTLQDNDYLVKLAATSQEKFIDFLIVGALQDAKPEEIPSIVAFGKYAISFVNTNTAGNNWLNDVETNNELLTKFYTDIFLPYSKISPTDNDGQQSFGVLNDVWNKTKSVPSKIAHELIHDASGKIIKATRQNYHEKVAIFLGDIFTYINHRGTKDKPGKIVEIILQSLYNAYNRAQQQNEKLLVIGHSLGGVILYDILTYYNTSEFKIDSLVTVGSQVGFFEELKLFNTSDPLLTAGKNILLPKPKSVKRWLNIYDMADIFSFKTDGIFVNEVENYSFESGNHLVSAHGGYFNSPIFFEKLANHLYKVPVKA